MTRYGTILAYTYHIPMPQSITVQTTLTAPIDKIWQYWTAPEHITQWYFASDDWCAPRATNDVRVGGRFTIRMEAKDGSAGFDFGGTYTAIEPHKSMAYTMDDGRKVSITFVPQDNGYTLTETFDPEGTNPIERQQQGWQAILMNFKKYVATI